MPEADKETEQPKVSSEIKDKPQAAPDLLYFNVMPKSQNNGQIVEPTVKSEVVNEEQDDKKEGFWEMVKKFKYYIIGLLAVIILIPGIYFGSSLLGSNMKTEDLLVKRTQTKSTPAANA